MPFASILPVLTGYDFGSWSRAELLWLAAQAGWQADGESPFGLRLAGDGLQISYSKDSDANRNGYGYGYGEFSAVSVSRRVTLDEAAASYRTALTASVDLLGVPGLVGGPGAYAADCSLMTRTRWREITVLSQTPCEPLPELARVRLGITAGQMNMLVRMVLRHPTRTLSAAEANLLRDRIYAGLHRGTRQEWAAAALDTPATQE